METIIALTFCKMQLFVTEHAIVFTTITATFTLTQIP